MVPHDQRDEPRIDRHLLQRQQLLRIRRELHRLLPPRRTPSPLLRRQDHHRKRRQPLPSPRRKRRHLLLNEDSRSPRTHENQQREVYLSRSSRQRPPQARRPHLSRLPTQEQLRHRLPLPQEAIRGRESRTPPQGQQQSKDP